ncbi:GGDEF domain-containing protein [Paenibacillus sp. SYP-B3998]|uniref:GGDEF domain-containing protein n=1 Tax=Paenibacillus sp. SYP-B3998 TaxID=2678564 RepID=A0A6G4A170_9BACL|nr:GGDEF domain-containing protein [Paenibacillus sp. SYP-B3998]NEW08236.1 GGDEF domain-containing protein [Paenibacillus sp. SYP-B3998]
MQTNAYSQDKQIWNRKLLHLYWGLVFVQIPVQFLYYLSGPNNEHFIVNHIVIPLIIMVVVMGLLEVVHKFSKRRLDYYIISGGALLSFLIIYFNYNVRMAPLHALLPIIVSIYYFQRSKFLFSVALSLVSILILFTVNDLLAAIPILGIATFIAFGIMKRGVEILINLRATTELKQELMIKNIIMDKLSKTDALTDLYNHITFHEYLEKLIEQSEYGHLNIHLAIIDIDNFKKVNDTYGHRAGDAVLTKVSAILKERVGLNDFAARYGGEEFAIIFTEKSTEDVYEILERIRWYISQSKYEELSGHAVTISIGLCEYLKGTGKEVFFAGADQSLYAAKKTGKNKTVIHTLSLKEAN